MTEECNNSNAVTIAGTGAYLPERVLTNADLEKMIDTSDEWIVTRTGMRERRIAREDEVTSEMAAAAAKQALESAGVNAEDVDLVIVATITPDMPFPSTACLVQDSIGAKKALCFDLEAACSGFLYALEVGRGMLMSGLYETALVIGAEKMSSVMDWEDRATCVLFGDGAGAVILEAADEDEGLRSINVGANGHLAGALTIEGAGSSWMEEPGSVRVVMDGREVFRNAVVGMEASARQALDDAGWTIDDVDLLIPHQANIRIIDATTKRLGLDPERVYTNIDAYGNTSAASIPIALSEAVDAGRIAPGAKIVFVAFGAGLTWGAATIQWGGRSEPIASSDAKLEPADRTGIDIMSARHRAWHR